MTTLAVLAIAAALAAAVLAAPRLILDPLLRKMLRPPLRPPRALPEDLQAVAEDLTIPGAAGPIKAWRVRPAGEAGGIVVLVHGWSSDSGRVAPLSRGALAAGWTCLLVDLPGHGRSGPVDQYNAWRMLSDLRAIRDWIEAGVGRSGRPCAVAGYSFGGLGAILSAARDRRWDAAVAVAAPSGPLRATEFYFRGKGIPVGLMRGMLRRSVTRIVGVDPATLDGPENLAAIAVPVLVVHGTEDTVVPVAEARRLASAIPGGRVRVLELPGANHDAPMADPRVASAIGEFLRSNVPLVRRTNDAPSPPR